MVTFLKRFLAVACLIGTTASFADKVIPMYMTADTGHGELVGTITIHETNHGLLITPNLHHLTPGIHGFHLHEHNSCEQNGMAAGGHFDPLKTGKHLGPYNDAGHMGDLPALTVNADGTATLPVLAPRMLGADQMTFHALMIHDGGDDYSDKPPMGGGGMRMACGVVGRK